MGSGPRAGLAEIFLPELQKGSSIMPGKVNPVIPEVVTQVAAQVIGNDAAIAIGGMQGHFELNVFVPLIARNLLDSIKLLASASRLLRREVRRRDRGEPRADCERYAELTLSAATALNPYIGYDKAAEIVKEAAASGRSLREVAREAGVEDVRARRGARLPQDGQAARLGCAAPGLPRATRSTVAYHDEEWGVPLARRTAPVRDARRSRARRPGSRGRRSCTSGRATGARSQGSTSSGSRASVDATSSGYSPTPGSSATG